MELTLIRWLPGELEEIVRNIVGYLKENKIETPLFDEIIIINPTNNKFVEFDATVLRDDENTKLLVVIKREFLNLFPIIIKFGEAQISVLDNLGTTMDSILTVHANEIFTKLGENPLLINILKSQGSDIIKYLRSSIVKAVALKEMAEEEALRLPVRSGLNISCIRELEGKSLYLAACDNVWRFDRAESFFKVFGKEVGNLVWETHSLIKETLVKPYIDDMVRSAKAITRLVMRVVFGAESAQDIESEMDIVS